jgi:hypothetical protein
MTLIPSLVYGGIRNTGGVGACLISSESAYAGFLIMIGIAFSVGFVGKSGLSSGENWSFLFADNRSPEL